MRRRELQWFAVALGVITIAHLAFRPFAWRFEWQRAIFAYGFVTVFSAPLAAAVAALVGANVRRSAPPIWVARRGGRCAGRAIGEVVFVTMAVHVSGLAVVGVVTGITNGSTPLLADLRPAASAMLLLVLATLSGWCVGWVLPSAGWTPPLVAAAWFVSTLVMFTSSLELVVRVGGATSSMLGDAVALDWLVRQWVVLGVAVALAAAIAVSLVRAPLHAPIARRVISSAVAASVIAVGVTTVAIRNPPPIMEDRDEVWECSGSDPEVCLTAGYGGWRAHLAAIVPEASVRWTDIGGRAPRVVTLDPRRAGQPGVMLLGTTSGRPRFVGHAVVRQDLGDRCIEAGLHRDSDLAFFDDWSLVIRYVDLPRLRKVPGFPSGFEAWLSEDTEEQQFRLAADALARLRDACE